MCPTPPFHPLFSPRPVLVWPLCASRTQQVSLSRLLPAPAHHHLRCPVEPPPPCSPKRNLLQIHVRLFILLLSSLRTPCACCPQTRAALQTPTILQTRGTPMRRCPAHHNQCVRPFPGQWCAEQRQRGEAEREEAAPGGGASCKGTQAPGTEDCRDRRGPAGTSLHACMPHHTLGLPLRRPRTAQPCVRAVAARRTGRGARRGRSTQAFACAASSPARQPSLTCPTCAAPRRRAASTPAC